MPPCASCCSERSPRPAQRRRNRRHMLRVQSALLRAGRDGKTILIHNHAGLDAINHQTQPAQSFLQGLNALLLIHASSICASFSPVLIASIVQLGGALKRSGGRFGLQRHRFKTDIRRDHKSHTEI